jgi:glyoxylase-like metal-dependent hydrolase (beta-lactamase superfamily II)
MKQIAPGIQQWSVYSPEKQLDFNGSLLIINDHCIIVDPPSLDPVDRAAIRKGPAVEYIILTNRDQIREAEACRAEFGAKVYVPAADAPLMDIHADKTFQDGELLPGGLWVIHLQGMKSPGESALFLDRGKGILIVGDALIGRPAGELSLLPADKFPDAARAKQELKRLLKNYFDMVVVGDGASVLSGGKQIVQHAIGA